MNKIGMTTATSVSEIKQCIYSVRGSQVILDQDIAKFYEVPPKRINEQVRRNATRFPADFMFQLEQSESLVSGSRATELG